MTGQLRRDPVPGVARECMLSFCGLEPDPRAQSEVFPISTAGHTPTVKLVLNKTGIFIPEQK